MSSTDILTELLEEIHQLNYSLNRLVQSGSFFDNVKDRSHLLSTTSAYLNIMQEASKLHKADCVNAMRAYLEDDDIIQLLITIIRLSLRLTEEFRSLTLPTLPLLGPLEMLHESLSNWSA